MKVVRLAHIHTGHAGLTGLGVLFLQRGGPQISNPLDTEAVQIVDDPLAGPKKRTVKNYSCRRFYTFDGSDDPVGLNVIPYLT